MRHRVLGVVAMLLLTACAGLACDSEAEPVAGSPEPRETTAPQVTAPPLDAPPGTTASAQGRAAEMGIGSYCWTSLCIDKIGPITRGRLDVTRGSTVIVRVPSGTPALRNVSITAFPAGASQDVGNGETAWRPDFDRGVAPPHSVTGQNVEVQARLDPGSYILVVSMFFDRGDVQYAVVLEVR